MFIQTLVRSQFPSVFIDKVELEELLSHIPDKEYIVTLRMFEHAGALHDLINNKDKIDAMFTAIDLVRIHVI